MVKLPKHKMAKTSAPRQVAGKRTKKHKMNAVSSTKAEENSIMEVENEEMINDDGDVSMEGGDAARGMKSKEEKKAIREARKKKNHTKNFYKIRAGNCTNRNGPRAINASCNI